MARAAQLVRRLTDNPRVRVPVLLLAAVMLLSSVQRLAVLLGHRERLAGIEAGDVLRTFTVGLRFDVVVAALLTLPLLVVVSVAPPSWLARKTFRRGVSVACAVVL